MALIHLIYASASAKGSFTRAELESLLAVARRRNAIAEVSGLLLYQNCSFFQVLEGERVRVEAVFARISRDQRHRHIAKILVEEIAGRDFGDWTMGFPEAGPVELATIPGLSDFFAKATSYRELGDGRAKLLLSAFRDGKWRSSIS